MIGQAAVKDRSINIREFRSCSPKQSEFLDACFAKSETSTNRLRYVLGGGQGFGGKSYSIRTGVIECAMRLRQAGVENPVQTVFCKTLGDVSGRHLSEVHRDQHAVTGQANGLGLFGDYAQTRDGHYEFRFAGRYKDLGICEFRHAGQLDRQKGIGRDYVWVDELTQFDRDEWAHITYWARTAKAHAPFLGIGAATNPDGVGNWWVKKLWVDRDFDGEFNDDPDVKAEMFKFIPFSVHDNPAANEEAIQMLQSLPGQLYKSRYLGEWDLLTGSRFPYNKDVHSFTWDQFVEFFDPERAIGYMDIIRDGGLMSLYASFDYGTSVNSASSYQVHARHRWLDRVHVWTLAELYMEGIPLYEQAKRILELEESFPVSIRYCDPALQGTKDFTARGAIDAFMGEGVIFWPAVNKRTQGWDVMEKMMDYKLDGQDLVRPPEWRVHESCRNLHAFLRNAPRDEVNPQDIPSSFKRDHSGDSARYGHIMQYNPASSGKLSIRS